MAQDWAGTQNAAGEVNTVKLYLLPGACSDFELYMQRWLKWCTGSHWDLEPFTSPNKCYRLHKAQKLVEFEAWKSTILVIYRLLDFPKSPSLLDMSTSRSSASQEAPGLHPTPLQDYHRLKSNTVLTEICLFEISQVYSVSGANQKVWDTCSQAHGEQWWPMSFFFFESRSLLP